MQLSRADFEQGLNDWLKQGKNTANTAAGFKQADPSDWQLKREVGLHSHTLVAVSTLLTSLLALHRSVMA